MYWKPGRRNLISIVGYKLNVATVIRIAQNASVTPAGVNLRAARSAPVEIVSRMAAILMVGLIASTLQASARGGQTLLMDRDSHGDR